jgi:hypothetical protein
LAEEKKIKADKDKKVAASTAIGTTSAGVKDKKGTAAKEKVIVDEIKPA